MASEKKPDYGKFEANFKIECNMDDSGYVFVLINKQKSPGKYHPVYKTECTPKK
jgi:hypothetical protein